MSVCEQCGSEDTGPIATMAGAEVCGECAREYVGEPVTLDIVRFGGVVVAATWIPDSYDGAPSEQWEVTTPPEVYARG